MVKLDVQSKIDFDRSIGTEDRFNLRKWFGKLVEVLNQSNPQIWDEVLATDLVVTGFLDEEMDRSEFETYLTRQFEEGDFVIRYPGLKATFRVGEFILTGNLESFVDGVLTCAGDVELRVVKHEDNFVLQVQNLSPRFRVQR